MAINPFTGMEEEGLDPITGLPVQQSFSPENLLQSSVQTAAVARPKRDIQAQLGPGPDIVPEIQPSAAPEMNPIVKEHLIKKFNLGNFDEAGRQKVLDQNNSYDTTGAITGALASLAAGLQGKDSLAAVGNVMDRRQKLKDGRLAEFDKGRAAKIQDYSLDRQVAKDGREDDLAARESDVESQESKIADELARRMGYKGPPLTATKFKAFSPSMEKMYEIEQRKLDRQEAREERRFQHGIKLSEKREREDEQDVQKLSKDIAGTQDLLGGLDEVEKQLGGKLEAFTRGKNGELIKGGKPVDLPGVSVPLVGRISAHSSDARDLASAASRVFNATLKDRSGGAVTDNEMERMKQEFNSGRYNTEAELISALQRYKRQTQMVLKDREAGFNPDVVSKYENQGGRTSKSLGSKNSGLKTVRMLAPDGSIREVPEEQVSAAIAAGGKRVDMTAGN